MPKKKKGAGGKLNRSEIIQARLNPKLRFAAELIATYERRTLSSLIESAVELSVKTCTLDLEVDGVQTTITMNDLLDRIWSPDEVVRFMKTGFTDPELLGLRGYQLWEFILWKPYFWSHYEVTIKDQKGNFIRKDWEPYHHLEGLVIENLKEYWELIKTEEKREEAKIPDKLGKKIKTPVGVETEIIFAYDPSKPLINREIEVERYQIWRENIHHLMRTDTEIIETLDGQRTLMKPIYPTPEEQMEMVERIYKERIKCQSNSEK